VTDPRGRTFISYRRTRAAEVSELARRLKARGIPQWIDISDLGPGSTEEQIIDALDDPNCASGIAWLTPEVADSAVIRRVEIPRLVQRAGRGDGFFAVMAVAGGLEYENVAQVAAENLGTADLRFWNLHKIEGDPAPAEELDRLADIVLRHRLAAVLAATPADAPLSVGFWVRREPPQNDHPGLQLDWHETFSGRTATTGAWDTALLPALRSVHREVGRSFAERRIVVHGHPTLATAFALGRAFSAVSGLSLAFEQMGLDGSRFLWSLSEPHQASGFVVRSHGADPAGGGLAVLVSVMHDASLAFRATSALPPMRAAIEVDPAGDGGRGQLTPGGAVDLANEIAEAIRTGRSQYQGVRTIHLFLACPAGLAVMLGQLLNAVGPITVYEHVDEDAVGHYRPEVQIPASGLY
jgi:SMODS-associated and fused to various effectors sensor domain/TIR domain